MCAALVACALPARAQTQAPALQTVLAGRAAALKALKVHAPDTLQVIGSIEGIGLQGHFHTWFSARGQRYDQTMGIRTQTMLRKADGQLFAVDENDNVREIKGLMLQRQHTQDFIDDEKFSSQTQYDTFKGAQTLPDGRRVYTIVVQPPDGLPEEIDLDQKTFMLDRVSYDDADGTSTSDYSMYKVYAGSLVALKEVDSNGDHDFDLTRISEHIIVDNTIPGATFDIPKNNVVQTQAPVTVKLTDRAGHYFTTVNIHGHDYTFLIDTGAQGIVVDSRVAEQIGLHPEGRLEVSGASRVGGLGIAALDGIRIGTALLPLSSVSVLDLHSVMGAFQPDGVLGYPFFASAEVQIDAANNTMTFAQPGMLHAPGSPIAIDVDRQMIETQGKVNGVGGRFILDTGNSGELLLYGPFMRSHPNLLPPGARPLANSFGVGGAAEAVTAYVDELDLSGFRFFNRFSNVMLSKEGAFADRFDAGNIGMGVLRNLVVTFDVANAQAYATQSSAFDDGRYRSRTEGNEALTNPH